MEHVLVFLHSILHSLHKCIRIVQWKIASTSHLIVCDVLKTQLNFDEISSAFNYYFKFKRRSSWNQLKAEYYNHILIMIIFRKYWIKVVRWIMTLFFCLFEKNVEYFVIHVDCHIMACWCHICLGIWNRFSVFGCKLLQFMKQWRVAEITTLLFQYS
jgi:hypothetical protein